MKKKSVIIAMSGFFVTMVILTIATMSTVSATAINFLDEENNMEIMTEINPEEETRKEKVIEENTTEEDMIEEYSTEEVTQIETTTNEPTTKPIVSVTSAQSVQIQKNMLISPSKIQNIFDANFNDAAVAMIAKTVYGEAGGIPSRTEQAAVIWCILNRYDSKNYPNDIKEVVVQPSQFHGYSPSHPVTEEIKALTVDVLTRWCMEKIGFENVGRVLPKGYIAFYGDGKHNYFSKQQHGEIWNWSLPTPYTS